MSKLDSFKEKFNMQKAQEKSRRVVAVIQKFGIVIMILAALVGGFLVGARFHELGKLDGVLGQTLKGATVTVSSTECMMNGELRSVPLVEDEIKVTYIDDKVIEGVIRKTRESISCPLLKTEISTLPLLKDLSTSPVTTPEIAPAPVVKRVDTSFKVLEKQTLVMSGVCKTQDGKDLPPFTDEKVAITSVEGIKEEPGAFTLSGIRKSDKVAILCSSRAIQYKIDDGVEPIIPEDPAVSFVGKLAMVTSKCVPDPRGVNLKNKAKRKVAFYNFSDSLVKISAQSPKEVKKVEEIRELTGTIMDESSPSYGDLFICKAADYPILIVPYDSEETELKTKEPKKAPVKTRTEFDEEQKSNPNQGRQAPRQQPAQQATVETPATTPAPMLPEVEADENARLLNQLNQEGEGK